MGQSFSSAGSSNNNNNNINPQGLLTPLPERHPFTPNSPDSTLRPTIKRVYSEQIDDGAAALSSSRSLPTSPSVRKRLYDAASTPLMGFESVLKNLEELAQHGGQIQWPTWVRKRGWFSDPSAQPRATSPVASVSAQLPIPEEGSGRVVQIDKDKWVFQRHRKKCVSPSISPVDDIEEKEGVLENMTEALQMNDMISQTPAGTSSTVTGGGQRSRRSSGYASASSSPSAGVKRLILPISEASVAPSKSQSSEVVEEETTSHQSVNSLYEVTLRWMFDGYVVEPVDDELSVELVNDSLLDLAIKTEEGAPESGHIHSDVLRIQLHIFRRSSASHLSSTVSQPALSLPTFIDFSPVPLPEDVQENQQRYYVLISQDGNLSTSTSFPREISCIDLIQQIVATHPLLNEYTEAGRLALYEKTWRSGKTSRARLRRLNDFDCPLVLAQQWAAAAGVDAPATSITNEGCPAGADPSGYAKTLVLQESQNGDIPWEDFTVAELSSFLRVLDREEAHHEEQIRRRYQLWNDRLRQAVFEQQLPTNVDSLKTKET